MATKKGIALTAAILISITAASFLVWLIPQNSETKFIVSNFEVHLDEIAERHDIVVGGIETQFQSLLDSEISMDEYVRAAELSSSQINSLTIELVGINYPQQWKDSYNQYIDSLEKYNAHLRETIVIANKINNLDSDDDIEKTKEMLNILKKESEDLALKSFQARP